VKKSTRKLLLARSTVRALAPDALEAPRGGLLVWINSTPYNWSGATPSNGHCGPTNNTACETGTN
jgi:hypothetical protein